MPILSEPDFSILEKAHGGGKLAEILDQKIVGRAKGLRVFDSRFEAEQPGTRSLQLDVAPGAQLRLMAFHQFNPRRKIFADIDADHPLIAALFRTRRDCVFQVMPDRMWWQTAQFSQTAVARKPRGIPAKVTNDNVIGMLTGRNHWREKHVEM